MKRLGNTISKFIPRGTEVVLVYTTKSLKIYPILMARLVKF